MKVAISTVLLFAYTGFLYAPSRRAEAAPPPSDIPPEVMRAAEAAAAKGIPFELVRMPSSSEAAAAAGPSSSASGDGLKNSVTGTAPELFLSGGGRAKGGNTRADQSAEAFMPDTGSPRTWYALGAVACVFAAAFCLSRKPPLVRGAVICAGAAGVFALAAWQPALAAFAGLAIAAVGAWPYIRSELDAARTREAMRAVAAGVDDPLVPPHAAEQVKKAIANHADEQDRKVIRKIKLADGIGKFS